MRPWARLRLMQRGRCTPVKLNYYHKALIVTAIAVFHTNVALYAYNNQLFTVLEAPKHWVLLFALLSLPVLLSQITPWNTYKSPVVVWCFGYASVTVLGFLMSSQSDLAWQEVRWRFLAIILIPIVLIVVWDPAATRLARKTLVGTVLFAVGLNIYELFAPMTFTRVIGRSAGLYENPNMAGEALVLGMILSVTVLKHRYRGPFLLLAGIGVFLTVSRASIVVWLMATAGLLLMRVVRPKQFLLSASVCLLVALLVLLPRADELLTAWERTGVINVNLLERLAWFADPSISDHSSWERQNLAKQAWDKVAERPVFGSGTGSYLDAVILPHNQYLSLMVDHGIIGMMIVPLLLLAVAFGARGETRWVALIFCGAVMVLSFFTHTILYTGHGLVLFSLMAAIAAARSYRESTETVAVEANVGAAVPSLVRSEYQRL